MYAVKWFTSFMTNSSDLGSLSLPKFRDRKFRVSVNISAKRLIRDHPFVPSLTLNFWMWDISVEMRSLVFETDWP